MGHLALIFIFLCLGMLLRLSGRMPAETTRVLGGWVVNVALPATALQSVHGVRIDDAWLLAAATPWAGALIAIAVFIVLGRAAGWDRRRVGGLVLVSGWGNTSFVGLPVIAAFAGASWLGLGLVIDLFGSYLALSTLGLVVAVWASGGRLSAVAIAKRIATFPPFLAIIVALATNDLTRAPWLTALIDALAATMTPLALAAVGFALRLDRFAGRIGALTAALSFRLLLAPALLLVVYELAAGAGIGAGEVAVRNVAILEMAMPPMLGATIIAMEHDLEPDLVALVIGLGIPLSLLTASLWWHVLPAV